MAPSDRPGEPVPAPLTADELVAVVRIHLDRVHDAVRRTGGLEGPAAVEVVRASALAMVDEVAASSLHADQAVGTWFRRALALAVSASSHRDGWHDVGDTLAGLPDDARTAVLLRDAYDLPIAAVAAALVTDEDGALRQVAQARLAVPAAGTPSDPPELTTPSGTASAARAGAPTPPVGGGHADLATLARLADDRPVPADARRHVLSCGACRTAVQGQSRAARVVAGVVVAGLDEQARASVVEEVEQRARELLPAAGVAAHRASVEEPTGPFALPAPEPADGVVPAGPGAPDAPDEPRRLLSPLLVVLSVVLAVLAGVGAGLLLSQREQPERLTGADGRLPAGVRLVSPQPGPPSTLPSPPTVAEQRPRTRVVVVPPSPLPTPDPPSPSPTPTPSATVAPAPALGLQPPSGPAGTELTISGTGFPPGASVRVDYLDAAGDPTDAGTDVEADGEGSLIATLAVPDAEEPGPHDVVATAGELSARATFTVEEP